MPSQAFRILAFVFVLGSFEYVAAMVVEKIDARGGWSRFAARDQATSPPNESANRVAIRVQKALVFTSAALAAIFLDLGLRLTLQQLGGR